jgi:hypothetical protein
VLDDSEKSKICRFMGDELGGNVEEKRDQGEYFKFFLKAYCDLYFMAQVAASCQREGLDSTSLNQLITFMEFFQEEFNLFLPRFNKEFENFKEAGLSTRLLYSRALESLQNNNQIFLAAPRNARAVPGPLGDQQGMRAERGGLGLHF